MTNNSKDYIIDIEIKDLIEETDAAARRTRWIIIVLVVATVIVGIGFYNSTKWSFSVERLEALLRGKDSAARERKSALPDFRSAGLDI